MSCQSQIGCGVLVHLKVMLEKEGQLSYTPNYAGAKERIITSIEEINLYDCNTLLITPATKAPPDAIPKPNILS